MESDDIFVRASKDDFSITVTGAKAKKVYDYVLSLMDISDEKPAPKEVINEYVKDGYLNKV